MPCFVASNLPSYYSADKTGNEFSLNGYIFLTSFQYCFGFFAFSSQTFICKNKEIGAFDCMLIEALQTCATKFLQGR